MTKLNVFGFFSIKWKGLLLITTLGVYVISCSPVHFEKQNKSVCESGAQNCVVDGDKDHYELELTGFGRKVDVLFVDDNSGSMSFEQKVMAEQFDSFIHLLDGKRIDYRIGVTTTDISSAQNLPRSINGSGALQDGKLISFGSLAGSFLSAFDLSAAQRSSLFFDVIQRSETFSSCEPYLNSIPAGSSVDPRYYQTVCPSDDERGIFAANLVIKNNPMSFIRSGSELAIVILSDEDERSGLYSKIASYRLQGDDLPTSLIGNFRRSFPSNTLAVHSIIVKPGPLNQGISLDEASARLANVFSDGGIQIKSNLPESLFSSPSDASLNCLNRQGNQTRGVKGSFGYLYALASRMTGGIEGDICADNGSYAEQIQEIGNNIIQKAEIVPLHCTNPQNLVVVFSGDPVPYEVELDQLKFVRSFEQGVSAKIAWDCIK